MSDLCTKCNKNKREVRCVCRSCHNEYQRNYYRNNPDQREKNIIKSREWMKNNPKKQKAHKRKFFKNNPDKYKEYFNKWFSKDGNRELKYFYTSLYLYGKRRGYF